jgi:DNA (cytosine-5)-methyltransferase 1
MRYVSLFSGIEAATVAFEPLGWEPLAFCEVDPFPCAVLAERFPNVPNLGDVKEVDWRAFVREHGAVDVVVGGSPCQSFSTAGDRTGLRGASGLMYEYIRAVREVRPRYLLWENVPGALSVERGGAFRQLLSELDGIGYGLAWRVLDAQFVRVPDRSDSGFFGPVAQRRRRVFVVGVLGSPHACEILFERESLRGHHPSGAKARAAIAADAQGCAGAGGAWGFLSDASAAGQVGNGPGASACLDTHGDHACAMVEQGSGGEAAAFLYSAGSSSRSTISYTEGVTPTFDTDVGHHVGVTYGPEAAGFKYHQGSAAGSVGFQPGISPCLTADFHNPAVVTVTTAYPTANGSNFTEDGTAYTIDTCNSNAVAFVQSARDAAGRQEGGDAK